MTMLDSTLPTAIVGLLAVFACPSSLAFAPIQQRPYASRQQLHSTVEGMSEGLLKTVSKPGQGKPVRLGDIATIKYSCYLPNDSKQPPFAKSSQQRMVVGDGTMITGWDKAVRTMSVGERAIVRISDPAMGYGEAGVPPLIPPNAEVEFDIEILDAQPPTSSIDFDSFATADSTPRTAAQIAAAYEARQAQKALEAQSKPELEGIEGMIAKAKNFYFFGLFEGETGERPPWFLQPMITFPLAFTVVGGAFAVSFFSGAITERGTQVTDELDEIILSSVTTGGPSSSSIMTALLVAGMFFK